MTSPSDYGPRSQAHAIAQLPGFEGQILADAEKIASVAERWGVGLGRQIFHDPRSRQHPVDELPNDQIKSVIHTRMIPILDQGQLGSCTGNAATGAIGTAPYFDTLSPTLKSQLGKEPSAEGFAVDVYSKATHVDGYRGVYPPDDTGSSGLAVSKVLYKAGLIGKYKHAFSLRAAASALQSHPFITGIGWYEKMFEPDHNGLVSIGGQLAGGHEIVCNELRILEGNSWDDDNNEFWFDNSWSTTWGRQGRFGMKVSTFRQLFIEERGDVTQFVPITA